MSPLGYFEVFFSQKNILKNFSKTLDKYLLGCYYINIETKGTEHFTSPHSLTYLSLVANNPVHKTLGYFYVA